MNEINAVIIFTFICIGAYTSGQTHEVQENINSTNTTQHSEQAPDTKQHSAIFTCPMHPNIKKNSPGTCPICGMDLVQAETTQDKSSIEIQKSTRRLASIETEKVQKTVAFQTIQAVGVIGFDEGRISNITTYTDGRIEKLYANYTGVKVKKGEHLARFYSPEIYTAQIEYLQAGKTLLKMGKSRLDGTLSIQKRLLNNAEHKLQELGMSQSQINNLKKTRKAKSRLVMDSTVSGTVLEKNAVEGSYIKAGQVIYKVADLSTVWLLLDMFPEDASSLRFGLKVKASVRSFPDQQFEGRISFISPVIDQKSRTIRIRVEMPNPDGTLRPGDLARALISIPIGPKGSSNKIFDPELIGKYISPMHPQEISDKPGKCSICGMDLIPVEKFGYITNKLDLEQVITISRDAVLSVGNGHVVFVEHKPNFFILRKIIVGPPIDDNRVVILEGLHTGEVIASSGVFLIDSQMQLSGKTSLLQVSSQQSIDKQHRSSHVHPGYEK